MKKRILFLILIVISTISSKDPVSLDKTEVIKNANDLAAVLTQSYANTASVEIKVSDVYNMINRNIITPQNGVQILDILLKTRNSLLPTTDFEFDQEFNFSIFDMLSRVSYMYLLSAFSPGLLTLTIYFLCDHIRFTILLLLGSSCFYFYAAIFFYLEKSYFISFFTLVSFNFFIYVLFLMICRLAEEVNPFEDLLMPIESKTKKEFYLKLTTTLLLLLTTGYFSIFFLRFYLNYILVFCLLHRTKRLIQSYTYMFIPDQFQPFSMFLSVIYGFGTLVISHVIYAFESRKSNDLNSFIIFANIISFAYLYNLTLFVISMQIDYGKQYNELVKVYKPDLLEKEQIIEEVVEKSSLVKIRQEGYTLSENKSKLNCFRADIFLMSTFLVLFVIGVTRSTLFLVLISFHIYMTLTFQVFNNFTVRFSRLVTSLFYLVMLCGFIVIEFNHISYLKEVSP